MSPFERAKNVALFDLMASDSIMKRHFVERRFEMSRRGGVTNAYVELPDGRGFELQRLWCH